MSCGDDRACKNYLRWCEKNGADSVFDMIDKAVDRGDGWISFVGYLPPDVVDLLERRGYGVRRIDCSGPDDPVCESYTIAWAG